MSITGGMETKRPLALPCAAFCAVLLAGGSAAAADLSDRIAPTQPVFTQVDPNTWIVTVTGNVAASPRYPGASRYTAIGYPSLDIRHAGEPRRFSSPDDGFSFALYDTDLLRLGPTARYVPGRYFGDDQRHLLGFRDARFAIEPGVFAEVYPVSNIRARLELRHGVYGHHGFVGSLGADYILPFDRFQFSIGPRFNFGDATYARKYFGVEPFEAAINGRVTPYRPNSFYAAGGLAALTYTPNETWAYTVYGGYSRILGDAADSPLVRRPFGNPNQFSLGLKVDYSFATPAWF